MAAKREYGGGAENRKNENGIFFVFSPRQTVGAGEPLTKGPNVKGEGPKRTHQKLKDSPCFPAGARKDA